MTKNWEMGVDTLEGHAVTLMDLDRLQKWINRILMEFNKSRVQHLGQNSSRHRDAPRAAGWKAALQERTEGSW